MLVISNYELRKILKIKENLSLERFNYSKIPFNLFERFVIQCIERKSSSFHEHTFTKINGILNNCHSFMVLRGKKRPLVKSSLFREKAIFKETIKFTLSFYQFKIVFQEDFEILFLILYSQ